MAALAAAVRAAPAVATAAGSTTPAAALQRMLPLLGPVEACAKWLLGCVQTPSGTLLDVLGHNGQAVVDWCRMESATALAASQWAAAPATALSARPGAVADAVRAALQAGLARGGGLRIPALGFALLGQLPAGDAAAAALVPQMVAR